MKRLFTATAVLAMLAGPAFAQGWNKGHDDHHPGPDNHKPAPAMMMHGPSHPNWHKGGRIEHADWNRGQRVSDWNNRHLSRPPRGYEWRRVDNNYVLAAVTTGLIASIIAANQ